MEESGEAELEVSCCRLVLRLDGRSTSELELELAAGGRRQAAAVNRADQGGGAVVCADVDGLSTYVGLASLSFVTDHGAWLG